MLVNRANVEEVFRNMRATYNQAYEGAMASTAWPSVAMEIRTTALVQSMDWISQWPNWREWVGDKVIQALRAYGYTIELREYEASIGVARRDLEADQLGIYSAKARSNGELAAYYPQERVFDVWNLGFSDLCFDGKPYFSTDHPTFAKSGAATTFSNKLTVPLSAATQAASLASLGAGKLMLRQMRNDQGRPVRVRNVRLVVPAALEDVANVLYTNDRLEDGKPNLYKGQFAPQVVEDLASATAWYLAGEMGGLRPAVHVVRKNPEHHDVTDPGDSHVVKTGEFIFSLEADSAVGWTLPQLAVGSTGAG